MSESSEYLYDVFISYSQPERQWVEEWLVPRLEQAGLRVAVDYLDFTVGMPRIDNIERAVVHSRRTIVVMTPDWLESEWNAFEALLLRTTDPAARQRKLLPVLLIPCEPPDVIAALETVDLTVERHWEKQLGRLTRDILDVIPVPPPWKGGGVRDFAQWKRWVRRYRRDLRRGAVALCAAWLAGSLTLQIPPFQPRQVWTSLGLHAPHATELVRTGDVLLAGGENVEFGCDHLEQGLWRSVDGGVTWQPVHAPLCFERPGQGQVLANIVGFALADAQPMRVYAATSDVGLLRSDDAGQTWYRTGDTGLESLQLVAVAVGPDDADRVFVAAQAGGIYRSIDGGQHWRRLDQRGAGAPACGSGRVLTRTMSVGALLAAPGKLLIGTGYPLDLTDAHVPAGLYASADGGECWEQVDDGGGHYQYVRVAQLAAAPGQPVLALIRDWWKEPGSGTWGLWRLDVSSSPARRELLWAHDHTVGALLVQDGTQPRWYAATDLGEAVRGSVDVPAQVERLPRITRCLLPPACDVALAPDVGAGPPMLLAGGRVFALKHGPWWRRVWP